MSHQRRRTWLSEAAIIAALVLLPLLFWWRLWAFDPANRASIPEGDFTAQYYPLQLFSARELAAGSLPAWDPYLSGGQPGLADIQTGTFYPLNLIPNLVLAWLGLSFGMGMLTAQVVVHFSLASLFTYLFVRHLVRRHGGRLGAARFSGAVAAVAFTYSGYLTTFPVQQITILETAIWLPLILLFLDRSYFQSRAVPQTVLAALALACAMLAGHPQTAMYVVYTVVAYGLYMAHVSGARFTASRLLSLLLVLVLGAALAAVQLVPTLGFIARSTRAGLDYESVSWGFPLAEVTHLLYPGYFGGSPQYVGILPMILAIASVFAKRLKRQVIFWFAVGATAFVLAFGGHTFLYSVAYLLAPGLSAVRNQERIIYLFSFSVSVLAGIGALTLAQPLPLKARRAYRSFARGLGWVTAAFAGLTAVWYFGFLQGVQQDVGINMFEGVLRHHTQILLVLGGSTVLFCLRQIGPHNPLGLGRVRRRWLMLLTLGLIVLNLFTINWRFNLAEPVAGGSFPESDIVAYLRGQPGPFRISSAGLLPGGASAGIVYELEDTTGNTPLRLDSYQQFEDRVGDWRRWQLLNVGYVLARRDLEGPALDKVHEEGKVKVYRVGGSLPRAWVVHNTRQMADEQALVHLNSDEFDPLVTGILPPESAVSSLGPADGPGGGAVVLEARPGRLVLEVSPHDDGLLVVSQPFYASWSPAISGGWRAEMDGQPVAIHRVDYLLQGLAVSAGAHRVELSYHLSPLPAIVSLLAVVVILVGLVLKR
ncbi:YfhO family protein [Chloroflexota bacterium]